MNEWTSVFSVCRIVMEWHFMRYFYFLWQQIFEPIHCATQKLQTFLINFGLYRAFSLSFCVCMPVHNCDLLSVRLLSWFSLSVSVPLLHSNSSPFTVIPFCLLCGQTTNHNYIAKCTSFSIKCMQKYMKTYILLFVCKQ